MSVRPIQHDHPVVAAQLNDEFDAVAAHPEVDLHPPDLREMPVLRAFARDLFQTRGCGETVDLDQIERHHDTIHEELNPSAIVPNAPGRRTRTGPATTGATPWARPPRSDRAAGRADVSRR